MGRDEERKKRAEKFLITEFVREALQYKISRPVWRDSPDAILTLQKQKSKMRVAIEHTGYYNNTKEEQARISKFWQRVQNSLRSRISHRKHLADLMGTVQLYTKRFARRFDYNTSAKQLAKEIVDLLEAHPITHFARFPSHSLSSYGTEFSNYPMLKSMVFSMRLERNPGIEYFSRHHWQCFDTMFGHIGFGLNYIKRRIEKKNEDALNYKWPSADEKWLLIATDGGDLSSHVREPKEQEWNDSELRGLCSASAFNKIYFWERVGRWFKSLKPNLPIVYTLRK